LNVEPGILNVRLLLVSKTGPHAEQKVKRRSAETIHLIVLFVEQVLDLANEAHLFNEGYAPGKSVRRGEVDSHISRGDDVAEWGGGTEIVAAADNVGDEVDVQSILQVIQDYAPLIMRSAWQCSVFGIPVKISVVGV